MKNGQIRLAMFFVWLSVSALILCTLIIPFVFSSDSLGAFLPECEWKAKYDKECPSCGMTSSFYYISEGKFIEASHANAFGIYLYFFFIINEIVLIFTCIKKSRRPGIF